MREAVHNNPDPYKQKWAVLRLKCEKLMDAIQGWEDLGQRLGKAPSGSSEKSLLSAFGTVGYYLGWEEAKQEIRKFLSDFTKLLDKNGDITKIWSDALDVYAQSVGTKADKKSHIMKDFAIAMRANLAS